MPKKEWDTDEDRMIYQLQVHKKCIGWVIEKLQAEGIPCKRTTGNDANGDILIVDENNAKRVQQIVREVQNKYN
jgi:hypothetical protein